MNQLSQPGLGVDLRRLREKAGMSTRSVASKIGVSHASVNRTELGTRRASETEVIALCALYGVVGRQRERLIERARGVHSTKTWFSTGSGATEQAASLVELEMEASALQDVSLTLIPGLVQTSDYGRQIIGLGGLDAETTEWLIRIRLSRQSLLSKEKAPRVQLIIDEVALRREVGGPEIMADQLEHLLRIGERDHVNIHVIPFNVGAHPAVDGSFYLMNFPERDPVVCIESRRGGLFLAEPAQVKPYEDLLRDLEEVMLDVPSSADLITQIKDAMAHE